MQILSLNLEDTKSYRQAQINFTEGVNAIVGHNGAGKSTILEAIGYALFDMIGYTANDFVRESAKLATITVSFISSVDERIYQVVRRCGRRTEYQIFDPDLQQKICEGKADVLSFLRRHMGVDEGADLGGLFRDAVGVPQGTFTAAFLQTASQRKNIFDPLLQVEEYRTAAEKLNEPRRLLKDRQAQLDVEISAVEARLERLPQLEAESQSRTGEIKAHEQERSRAERELATVALQRSELETVRQQVSNAELRHTQAEQRCTTMVNQLENARRLQQQAVDARQIVQQNQVGHDRYLQAQAEQQKGEEQSRQRQKLLQQQAAADKAFALVDSEIKTQQQALEEVAAAEQLVAHLQPAADEQTNLEKRLAELQQQRARLADAEQAQQRQQQELQRLEGRKDRLPPNCCGNALRQQQGECEGRINTLQQEIDDRRNHLAQFKAEADALKAQSDTLGQAGTATCPVCEQPLTEKHRANLLQRNQQRVTDLRARYATEQNAIKTSETSLKQQRDQLQQANAELLRLPREDEAVEVNQRFDALSTEVQRLAQQISLLQRTPAEIGEIEQRLRKLDNPRQRSQVAAARAVQRPTLESKLQQAQSRKRQTEAELATVQQQLAAFSGLDAALEAIAKSLQSNTAAYQQVLSHRRTAESVEEHTSNVVKLESLLATAQQELAERKAELATIASKFDAVHFRQVQDNEQQLRSQVASLQTRLSMLHDAQRRAEQEIELLRQQQGQVEDLKKRREGIANQEQILESMRSALRQAGPHITKALIGQISNGASQIFGDLMQDYSRQLRWSEDYGISLEVDGHQRQFSQLSGGEQMSAALSVRLALLREMSNIDVAFFDEPTTNLDDARRESLARQILDVRGFRQLFVISHDDTFEQATQNVIRVQRVEGRSEIVSN
ncbi:MAG: SMC family ATPase [Caldilineaceae bacterium]